MTAPFIKHRAAVRLEAWLVDRPGVRIIITGQEVELCARAMKGLPRDDWRYVSRVCRRFEDRGALLLDCLEEILTWEENGWGYEV